MPELLAGGLAVALVGLAQAAGISAAVPNPDGKRPRHQRRFRRPGCGQPGRRILRRAADGRVIVPHRRGRLRGSADPVGGHLRRNLDGRTGFGRGLAGGVDTDARDRWTDPGDRRGTGRRPMGRHQAGVAHRAAVGGGDARHVRGHHGTAAAHRDPDRRDHVAGAVLRQGLAVGTADRACVPSTAAGSGRRCPNRLRATRSPCCTTRGSDCSPRCPGSTRSGRRWRTHAMPSWCCACGAARRAVVEGDQGAHEVGDRSGAQRRPVDHRRREPDGRSGAEAGRHRRPHRRRTESFPRRHECSARSRTPSSAGGSGSPRTVASA